MLLGAGMLLQGLVPTFAAVLVAQVVWGTGSTFLSGADEAWLADEIGEDAVGPVFTRETQISLALALAAPLAAGGLGLLGLGVPVAASGGGCSSWPWSCCSSCPRSTSTGPRRRNGKRSGTWSGRFARVCGSLASVGWSGPSRW